MKTKTVKRLVILVVTILVVGLSIVFIQRHQVSKMNRSVLAQAYRADKNGDYEAAARLYEEYIAEVPKEPEAKLKYAEVLLKGEQNAIRQAKAAEILDQLVNQDPGNDDYRRRRAELSVEMRNWVKARDDLVSLLKKDDTDVKLHFLLGECYEALDDATKGVASYQAATVTESPSRLEAKEWLEAYRRRASLLRGKLDKHEEADQLIEEMVRSDPTNPRVRLEYARYRSTFAKTDEDKKVVIDEYQKALKQLDQEPEAYVELAVIFMAMGNAPEARRVLENGIEKVPSDAPLHRARASLADTVDAKIASLRQSVQVLPDDAVLHWLLAEHLADKGDVTELQTQIEELRRLNYFPDVISFLEARQQVNSKEWQKARQTLNKLEARQNPDPKLKTRLYALLALCYGHLGDRDRQGEAYRRVLAADSQNILARLGLAQQMASRGELEPAIEEYRKMADKVPVACSALVRLLIARNLQRPASQRDWTEIARLIKKLMDFAPNSSEGVILQTDLLLAQDKTTEAESLLADARSRLPRNVDILVKSAELLRWQRKYPEAGGLLDQAHKIGDTVSLRLERARLLIAQRGADLSRSLAALTANSNVFSPDDRQRLFESISDRIIQLNDLPLAEKLLLDLIDLDRNSLEPRLRLIDLALRSEKREVIETQIREIKQIDGADGPIGRLAEIQYTLWQAEHTTDKDEQKALRNSAKLMITELSSRRPDWSQIPRALALLEEQELAQPDLDDATKKHKLDEAANHYLRAIERGYRDFPFICRATELLSLLNRNSEIDQLLSQLPAELREAVNAANAARSDPKQYLALVLNLIKAKQIERAELTERKAEAAFKDKAPIVLAKCCDALGQAYMGAGQDAQKSKIWFDAATQWYKTAHNTKPDDPAITLQLLDFLLRSGQLKAQNQIDEACKLIQTTADQPNLRDEAQVLLAGLAEKLGRFDLAERLFRQMITRSERVQNRLELARFLGRHGRSKEAMDECERLWKATTNPAELVSSTVDVLFTPGSKLDPAEVERAAGWIQKGLQQKPNSSPLRIALATLRERQGMYPEAEALYRQVIELEDGNWVALNNLAWLLALRNEKLNEALDLINRAINRRGNGPLAEFLDTRGGIYTKLGDARHAIEDLDQAIVLAPSGPKYFHLAQADLRVGDKGAAASSLNKARAIGLKPADLHPLEATAYHQVLTELEVE
jgi:cellulose synthase operon protein C